MSLASGTMNTECDKADRGIDFKQAPEICLSAKEICQIIQACNKNQVASFAFGNLCINFRTPGQETAVTAGQPADFNPRVEVTESFTDELSHNESAMEEAEQGMLMVEDPLEYERLQIDRHIERERNADA